ncbi:strigolactone esterase D14-like [Macadamia integrifolia]|uniref:strigolactone esterase D14-like n=1 Tax=Macadamia integrifolia TaxID=60698 RepID=UPI001C527D76|nr:strigolactone esterase D14-like [Macadamia integrifolia]
MVTLEKSLSTSMNAKIIGSGKESLVLAHGYGGDQSVWEKVLPQLAQRYRVMVFDWSFSGAVKDLSLFDHDKYSSLEAFADDLIVLMEEMKLTSSVLIGHSMSGMVGCIASVKRPDLFKKLILLGASPRYLNTEDYKGGFEKSEVEELFSNIESNFHAWAPNFAGLGVGPTDTVSVEKFGRLLGQMRPEVALSLAKTIFCCDHRDVLEKVDVPCTIVQTTNDIVVPLSVVYYMQKKIKGKTTVEILEADGHFPQLTAHQLLLDVLDRVLGVDSEEKNP